MNQILCKKLTNINKFMDKYKNMILLNKTLSKFIESKKINHNQIQFGATTHK